MDKAEAIMDTLRYYLRRTGQIPQNIKEVYKANKVVKAKAPLVDVYGKLTQAPGELGNRYFNAFTETAKDVSEAERVRRVGLRKILQGAAIPAAVGTVGTAGTAGLLVNRNQ
jgi:hypothetical protein